MTIAVSTPGFSVNNPELFAGHPLKIFKGSISSPVLEEIIRHHVDDLDAKEVHSTLQDITCLLLCNPSESIPPHYLNTLYFGEKSDLIRTYQKFCLLLLKNDRNNEAHEEKSGSSCNYDRLSEIERGVILSLSLKFSGESTIRDEIKKICDKEKKLLDAYGIPLKGLFVKEEDFRSADFYAWNYLLFFSAGVFLNEPELLQIADKQRAFLRNKVSEFEYIRPLITIIEDAVLSVYISPSNLSESILERKISDADYGLAGWRSGKKTAMSLCYGEKTGSGSYMFNSNLGIIVFGPQYLPYGDCRTFGIKTCPPDPKKFSNPEVSFSESGYKMAGYTKIPGKENDRSHNELWIDMLQEYRNGTLYLDITYLGYETLKDCSFAFYISSETCTVEKNRIINPKSLDHYSGIPQNIVFTGEHDLFTLSPGFTSGTMEIIPLGGNDNFWKGDFLVGFSIEHVNQKYKWEIKSHE